MAEPFDHPDWLYELKHDGFRAFAHVDGSTCRLVSRNGHVFGQWPDLGAEIAQALHARRAVLDGEVVCLRSDGNSDFNALLFRGGLPHFYAFDALSLGSRDLRSRPLVERKRRLRDVMPHASTRLRYVDDVRARGSELFRAVCAADAEGVVGKWVSGTYHTDGTTTSWVKVKNRGYSQMEGRHELFAERGAARTRRTPTYRLDRAVAVAWS